MSPVRENRGRFSLSRLLAGWVDVLPEQDRQVSGICHDSRQVHPGDLFFALSGNHSHGMKHASQAISAGACAIIYDPARGGKDLASVGSTTEVPCFPVERLDLEMGLIADRFFDEPSRQLDVIGVTGTNGKTSCSHFLAHALSGDKPAAVIGTLGWGIPGALRPTAHTTPDAIEIHGLLSKLLTQGVGNVAVEASSHGLDQGRLNGVRFEGGLFTNLSRDHLDYHGCMESYLEAKLRLLAWPGLKYMAFNLDDESSKTILERNSPSIRKIGFTLTEKYFSSFGTEIVRASEIRHEQAGVSFDVRFEGKKARVFAPLYGDFNVENLLGTIAVLLAKGFELEHAAQRVNCVRAVPGRMEVFGGNLGPTVVIDYAHTPDALRKTLSSLRSHCRGSLWVVFGCGGDRDRGKRPQMGSIAEKLADRVVLTDDNPRSEEGDVIIQQILNGCERQDIMVMRDRSLAIACALEQLVPGDVLLVAGKGHEDNQEIAGVKYPFSDREVVRNLLNRSNGESMPCA